MTPDWRVMSGVLVLLAVIGLVLISGRGTSGESSGSSIIMSSALLEWDLPGTLPHPQHAAATGRLQAVAERRHLSCGPVEVFQTTQPTLLHATLEEVQAQRHYLRFKDNKNNVLSQWEGPNRLLMVEGENELLLCALDWPMSG